MEPLHPADREALKRAHPGLTDADIDRAEELIAEVELLGDLGRTEEAEEVSGALSEFVRQRMPRYNEVVQDASASRRGEVARRRLPPRVIKKKRPR